MALNTPIGVHNVGQDHTMRGNLRVNNVDNVDSKGLTMSNNVENKDAPTPDLESILLQSHQRPANRTCEELRGMSASSGEPLDQCVTESRTMLLG